MHRYGISRLVVESDKLMMVKECQQADQSSSRLGILVAKIKSLNDAFVECSF